MTSQPAALRAVILSTSPSARHLARLTACAVSAGVSTTVVRSVDRAAAELSALPPRALRAVILDATGLLDAAGADAAAEAAAKVTQVSARCRDAEVIVVAAQPPAELVVACFRAGAVDFVNTLGRPERALRDAVARAGARSRARIRQRAERRETREVVEELLRDLVVTERRSLRLEQRLAAAERPAASDAAPAGDRQPVVLLVDPDPRLAGDLAAHLEDSGVVTHAFATGVAAVTASLRLSRRAEPIDLAVVDAALRGMGAREVIRCLREVRDELSVLLMTGPRAGRAATDLDLRGCIRKPFTSIAAVAEQVREQAVRAMADHRDRFYLGCIKQRHEVVFSHYLRLVNRLGVAKPQ